MASGSVNLGGKVINQAGADKVGLTVNLYQAATWESGGAATSSTTTDADGLWAFAAQDITKTWIIDVVDGTKHYLIDARNKIQLTELDLITSLNVNTIYEHTAGSGVTIDSVLLKDNTITGLAGLAIRSTGAAYDLTLATDTVFTAGRTLTIRPGDAARILTFTADASIGGTISGTNTGDVTLAGTPDYITITNQVITRAKLDPADDLNTFASSVLATLVTDETGSGALVFGTAPTLAGGTHTALTGLGIRSTGTGAFDMTIANAENLAAGRTLTIQLGDAARTLILGASPSLSGTNTGDQTITLTGEVTGTGTGSFAATVAATHSGSAHHAQQSLFETIAVSGQSSVVADSATDTLTLAAGTNITITTDATTDTITITAAGASGANTALSNLAAVAINTALLDDAAAADDFGSATLPWKDIFIAGSSGTPGTNNFRITGASTSGTRVITLPDASGTLLYAGGALGTPASGTMTNVTGIPAAAILAGSFGAGAYVISTSLQAATIELGHATDTTISRTGAGAIAVEGTAVLLSGGALGTPASGTMTNVTGIPVSALANGTDGQLITWDASGVAAVVATGTSGQVLTSNGAGAAPTFQAAAGADPVVRIVAMFEATSRYVISLTSGGAVTFDSNGSMMDTSATGTSGCRCRLSFQNALVSSAGSPSGSARITAVTLGTDFDFYFGMKGTESSGGGAITFTFDHFGGKITRRTSGTISLFATQANGTTETASAALATVAANDEIELMWKVNGTTSADYYWRQNAGAKSAATNLATNVSTSISSPAGAELTNAGVASQSKFQVACQSYER